MQGNYILDFSPFYFGVYLVQIHYTCMWYSTAKIAFYIECIFAHCMLDIQKTCFSTYDGFNKMNTSQAILNIELDNT